MREYEGTRVLLKNGEEKDYPGDTWRETDSYGGQQVMGYEVLKPDGAFEATFPAAQVESIERGTFVMPWRKWLLGNAVGVAAWLGTGLIWFLAAQASVEPGRSERDASTFMMLALVVGAFWLLATIGIIVRAIGWTWRKATHRGHHDEKVPPATWLPDDHDHSRPQ